MKKFLTILAVLITVSHISSAHAQTSTSSKTRTTTPMAKEGDTVWVYVNHIKADKRQPFERFVHEIFWPYT